MSYIYGAGRIGKRLLAALVADGEHITAFLDRAAKPGDSWRGIPIIAPEDGQQNQDVFMGTFGADYYEPDIVTHLLTLGYRRVRPFLQVHALHARSLGDILWLTAAQQLSGPNIDRARSLLADDKSREIWDNVLSVRSHINVSLFPKLDPKPQYFDPSLPKLTEPVRFLDAGAADGDTIRDLAATGATIESVLAFEPDAAIFAKLATLPFPFEFHCANLMLGPEAGGRAAFDTSRGETLVGFVTTIDDAAKFSPTFIKMDLEGDELNALWGAKQTLKRCRPQLAICMYHRPAHLWQVPLLIDELCGPGEHHLRLYAHNGFELVDHYYPRPL